MSDSSSSSSSSSDSENSPKKSTPAQSSKAKDDDKSSSSGSSSDSESPGPTKNVESKVEAVDRDNSEASSPTKSAESKIEPKVGNASNLLDSDISGSELGKKQENKALVAAADVAPADSASIAKKIQARTSEEILEDSAGSVKKKQVRTSDIAEADVTSENSESSTKKLQVRKACTADMTSEVSVSSVKKQQVRKVSTSDVISEDSVVSEKKQQVRKVRTANMSPDDSTGSAKKQQVCNDFEALIDAEAPDDSTGSAKIQRVRHDFEALMDADAHGQKKSQATTPAKTASEVSVGVVDRDASSEGEFPPFRKNAKVIGKTVSRNSRLIGRAPAKGRTMSSTKKISIRLSKDSKLGRAGTCPSKTIQALCQFTPSPKAKTSPMMKSASAASSASRATLPAQPRARCDTVKAEVAAPKEKRLDTIAPIVAKVGKKTPKSLRKDRMMRMMEQIARKDPPLPDVVPIKNLDSVILPMVTLPMVTTRTRMARDDINRLDVDVPFIAKYPAGHPGRKEAQTTDVRMFEAAFDICRTPAVKTLDRAQARNWLRCIGWCLDDYGLDAVLDFDLSGPRPALAVDEQEKKQKTSWNLSTLIILAKEVLNNNSGIENATTEALKQGIDSLVCGKQHVTLRRVYELLDRELRFDPELPVEDIERVLEKCGLVEGTALDNVEFAHSLFDEIVTAGHAHCKNTKSLPFFCD